MTHPSERRTRVRGSVATLQPDLVHPQAPELVAAREEPLVDGQPAACGRIGLDLGQSWSAGSAGMVIPLPARHSPSWRLHSQTEADRSSVLTTTPTKPQVCSGSWDGRSSRAIWCCSSRSTVCRRLPAARSQKCSACPYLRLSSSSGLIPSSIIDGVPHSLVMSVF